jgi:hypothetical protein
MAEKTGGGEGQRSARGKTNEGGNTSVMGGPRKSSSDWPRS